MRAAGYVARISRELNSVAYTDADIKPTEQLPLVGEVTANFFFRIDFATWSA
jgi:hypothetical protein